MKRLWKTVPPCRSDVQGFQAVVTETAGIGIVDDPSTYKPISFGRGGRGGFGGGRPDWHHGENGNGNPEGHRGGFGGGRHGIAGRVADSEIRTDDIIYGTEKKVLDTFELLRSQLNPEFALLSAAPSSSMIGSDHTGTAEKMAERGGIPAASVPTDGSKDYAYGVSVTLEAMGKMLLEPAEQIPGSVNILGCNTIDWTEDALTAFRQALGERGRTVLSVWGMKETTENLRRAAGAELNLVVHVSGLRLARYMEAEYGIPYIVGAPFGTAQTEKLLNGEQPAKAEGAPEAPEVLVVGEQFTANACRAVMEAKGIRRIRVLSFYEFDRSSAVPGDVRLSSEDDWRLQAGAESVRLILGDPDLKAAAKPGVQWLELPNGGSIFPIHPVENRSLFGSALDIMLGELSGGASI